MGGMKRSIGRVLMSAAWCAAAFILLASMVSTALSLLPDAVEMSAPSALNLNFMQVERLRKSALEKDKSKRWKESLFAKSDEQKQEISMRPSLEVAAYVSAEAMALHPYASMGGEAVTLLRVSEGYGNAAGLIMKQGIFFSVSQVPEENRVAVISDALATRLFMTDDAAGKEVKLNGTLYTITGVYRESDSFLARVSGIGKSAVYIPYLQSGNEREERVRALLWKDQSTVFTAALKSEVEDMLGTSFYAPRTMDYGAMRRLISEFVELARFFAGVCVIGILALGAWRLFTRAASMKRAGGLLNACIGLLLLLAGAGVFMLVRFTPYLPHGWLPDDNLFDLGFYYEKLMSLIEQKNAWSVYDRSMHVLANALLYLVFLSIPYYILLANAFVEAWGIGKKKGLAREAGEEHAHGNLSF